MEQTQAFIDGAMQRSNADVTLAMLETRERCLVRTRDRIAAMGHDGGQELHARIAALRERIDAVSAQLD